MSRQRLWLPRSARMLDIRAASPETPLIPYSHSPCVAPCDIFPDYDRVMAHLKGEEELVDANVARKEPQMDGTFEDIALADNVSGSYSDRDSDVLGDTESYDDDDEAYFAKPRARHATSDISNTYSSGGATSKRRATRRPRPYEGSTVRRHAIGRSASAHSLLRERCAYINPHDGKRCQKLNKTPQEAGRHWRSCHLYKEAKEMLSGVLAVGKGTAITSEAQLVEVTPLIQCPFCNALITRSDAMQRHVRTNCRAERTDEDEMEGTRSWSEDQA